MVGVGLRAIAVGIILAVPVRIVLNVAIRDLLDVRILLSVRIPNRFGVPVSFCVPVRVDINLLPIWLSQCHGNEDVVPGFFDWLPLNLLLFYYFVHNGVRGNY